MLLFSQLLNCMLNQTIILHQTGKTQVQFNIDIIDIAIVEVRPILVRAEKTIVEADIVKKLEMSPKWLLAQLKNQNTTTTIITIGISIDQGKNLHQNLAINSFLSFLIFCMRECWLISW